MQRLCGFLVCRFLIVCVAAGGAAAASAGAAPLRDVPAAAGTARAFLYEDGTMKGLDGGNVLDDLIGPGPEGDIADAVLLDDISRLAAAGCGGGPCEVARRGAMPAAAQPAALVLLGAGVALLGWRRHQAWRFTPLAPRCPG